MYAGAEPSPQEPFLAAAGVEVRRVAPTTDPASRPQRCSPRAEKTTVVRIAGPEGDPELALALGELVATDADAGRAQPEIEVVGGSYDLPGARLLDLVAVMDRLRSPGGCPWDARQTHDSLVTVPARGVLRDRRGRRVAATARTCARNSATCCSR